MLKFKTGLVTLLAFAKREGFTNCGELPVIVEMHLSSRLEFAPKPVPDKPAIVTAA